MLRAAGKYRQAFLLGLQGSLVYRWNFAVRGFFSLFHLAAVFILWGAAFAGREQVGGFDLRQTLTYFTTILFLQFLISAFNEDYQISEEIRQGLINQFLLKPINYFLYRLSIFAAARLVSGALSEPWRLAAAVPALFLSALVQFTIAYCFGLMTFWFLEIQGLVVLSMAVEAVLGGQIFPLDLLPPALHAVARFLPFYYQMYFPAAILTGRIGPTETAEGLALQAGWVVLLLLLAHALWVRGLRRHTAVGG